MTVLFHSAIEDNLEEMVSVRLHELTMQKDKHPQARKISGNKF